MPEEYSGPTAELELRVNSLARSFFAGFVVLVVGQLPTTFFVALVVELIGSYFDALLPKDPPIGWFWGLVELGLLSLVVLKIWRPALRRSRAPESAPLGDPKWSKYNERSGTGLFLATGAAVALLVYWMADGYYKKPATIIVLEVFLGGSMVYLLSFLTARFHLQRRVSVDAVVGLGLLSGAFFWLYRL